MAQITQIITIHDYNKMTDEQRTALGGENMLAVVQQDWEEARIQAAMYAMQGQLANQVLTENMIESVENVANFPKVVANASVRFADALIEELKKGG